MEEVILLLGGEEAWGKGDGVGKPDRVSRHAVSFAVRRGEETARGKVLALLPNWVRMNLRRSPFLQCLPSDS